MNDREPLPIRVSGDGTADGDPDLEECDWCGWQVPIGRLSTLDVRDEPCPEDELDVCRECDPGSSEAIPCAP